MKILLFILPMLIATSLACAGTPDEDPIVAKIQSEFKNAPPVTLAALQLGKTWGNCSVFSAAKGNFSVGNNDPENISTLSFSSFDGLINVKYEACGWPDFSRSATLSEGELVYNYTSMGTHDISTDRITLDGTLIEEYSTNIPGMIFYDDHTNGQNDGGEIVAPAVGTFASTKSNYIIAYSICFPLKEPTSCNVPVFPIQLGKCYIEKSEIFGGLDVRSSASAPVEGRYHRLGNFANSECQDDYHLSNCLQMVLEKEKCYKN